MAAAKLSDDNHQNARVHAIEIRIRRSRLPARGILTSPPAPRPRRRPYAAFGTPGRENKTRTSRPVAQNSLAPRPDRARRARFRSGPRPSPRDARWRRVPASPPRLSPLLLKNPPSMSLEGESDPHGARAGLPGPAVSTKTPDTTRAPGTPPPAFHLPPSENTPSYPPVRRNHPPALSPKPRRGTAETSHLSRGGNRPTPAPGRPPGMHLRCAPSTCTTLPHPRRRDASPRPPRRQSRPEGPRTPPPPECHGAAPRSGRRAG